MQAFSNLFPHTCFENFQFPFVEDLVNAHLFTTYHKWREERDMPVGAPLPPMTWQGQQGEEQARDVARTAGGGAGVQLGAFSHRSHAIKDPT